MLSFAIAELIPQWNYTATRKCMVVASKPDEPGLPIPVTTEVRQVAEKTKHKLCSQHLTSREVLFTVFSVCVVVALQLEKYAGPTII